MTTVAKQKRIQDTAPVAHDAQVPTLTIEDARAATSVQARDAAVVTVAGEVDIDTAPLLEDHLLGLTGPIRVDLRAVTFMDSSSVRALVRMDGHCERDGRSLSVQACFPPVGRLLRSLGRYDILTDDQDRGQLAMA